MKINYSIVSRGTEKYNNHGYMAISFDDKKGYIFNSDHGLKELIIDSDTLIFNNEYSISNIAISRFGLISRLLLERVNLLDGILICGLGDVGFSLLIELLKKGYKNIDVYSRSISNNIDDLNIKFNSCIKIVNDIKYDYSTYIDTTGSSSVLKCVFENSKPMSKILILSTPREGEYLINPLMINRKNLCIYGGHEIFGIDLGYRERIFNTVLCENKKLEDILCKYVSIHDYSIEEINNIKKEKSNFVDVIRY